jgi:hypothetical protein
MLVSNNLFSAFFPWQKLSLQPGKTNYDLVPPINYRSTVNQIVFYLILPFLKRLPLLPGSLD